MIVLLLLAVSYQLSASVSFEICFSLFSLRSAFLLRHSLNLAAPPLLPGGSAGLQPGESGAIIIEGFSLGDSRSTLHLHFPGLEAPVPILLSFRRAKARRFHPPPLPTPSAKY